MRWKTPSVLAAATLVLAACTANGDGEPDEPTPPNGATTEPEQTEPEPTETESAEEPTDGEPTEAAGSDDPEETDPEPSPDEADDEGEVEAEFLEGSNASPDHPSAVRASEEPMYPVEVRTGSHDGFDRVVIEYEGDGLPGWRATYEGIEGEPVSPAAMGSGAPIDIDGEVFLHVDTTGLAMGVMAEDGIEVADLTDGPAGVIADVASGGVFEGHGSFYIGLDAERDYRMTLLEEPSRVVIDVDAS